MPNLAIHLELTVELELYMVSWWGYQEPGTLLAFSEFRRISGACDSTPSLADLNPASAFSAIAGHHLFTVDPGKSIRTPTPIALSRVYNGFNAGLAKDYLYIHLFGMATVSDTHLCSK